MAPHAPQSTTRDEIDGVSIERFRYFWPATAETLCYGGGALLNLRRNRWNVLKLPAFLLSEWGAVSRRLARGRYHLLHSHWILPQGFVGALAAAPWGIPHVLTVHGGDAFALGGRVLTKFKRFTLQRADAVTVNSSATSEAVTTIAPSLQEIHRIPMGASLARSPDPEIVGELRKRFRTGSGPLLVFVGRIIEAKGVADVLRAVAMLASRLPDVTAIFVGDGPDRPRMETMVGELGIGKRVAFTGWVKPDDVPNYLAAADVFVGPSKRAPDGWTEGQGLTFVEAMLCRTPVIATRAGGIVDAVHHEKTGLLVSEDAPDEIVDAVHRLVVDTALARRLSEDGFTFASQNLTRRATAQSFSSLFQRLLSVKGRSIK